VVPLLGPVKETTNSDTSATSRPKPKASERNADKALAVLRANPDGLSWGEWQAASDKAGLTLSQFNKARDKLKREARVWQDGETYFAVEGADEVPMAA
jgi:hypothetical protein